MLFNSVIFGPVQSRRLGVSLGVNLLPTDCKLCNFNCIYCECGWNTAGVKPRFNSRELVREELEKSLRAMAAEGKLPDFITFSGNGEPTMHPDFEAIINDTIALRDALAPQAKIAVLTNATMIGRESVERALRRVDRNILKLDSAFDETVRAMDNPNADYSVRKTVELMKRFKGRMYLQTMFLRSDTIDNTTEREVSAWLDIIKELAPLQVMIYTIDRATPAKGLHKIPVAELEEIAHRVRALGVECSVSG